jgi:predicted transcriptional regulator
MKGNDGMTAGEIATEAGCCINTARKYIKAAGVKFAPASPSTPNRVPKGKANDIIKAIKKGKAEHFGIGK